MAVSRLHFHLGLHSSWAFLRQESENIKKTKQKKKRLPRSVFHSGKPPFTAPHRPTVLFCLQHDVKKIVGFGIWQRSVWIQALSFISHMALGTVNFFEPLHLKTRLLLRVTVLDMTRIKYRTWLMSTPMYRKYHYSFPIYFLPSDFLFIKSLKSLILQSSLI